MSGFQYDIAGNMTNNGTGSFVYDAENRIISAGGMSYLYDGDGNRVEKCTAGVTAGTCATGATGTLYWRGQGSETLNESDLGAGAWKRFTYFNGKMVARRDSATGNLYYFYADHLGSIGVVTDALGQTIVNESDYYPYGGERVITNALSDEHYKFTGKERDAESGLDDFGFRYFGSSMGRFMSADDSTDQDADNPQSWNLYSYVRNNPLKYTDPDGHDCIYVDSDSGKMTGFNQGDCDNSTEEKANSGIYVDGTVNSFSYDKSSGSLDYSYTGENGSVGVGTILGVTPPQLAPMDNGAVTPGMLGPGDLILFSGVKVPSVVTDAVGKLVGSILGKGVQQGTEQAVKESVQLTTHAALRLGQRGITQAAVDEAVATAKAAGQVATQLGKYGTEQIVYKGTNGITVIVETQGSNAGKAVTVFATGSKP